MKIPEAEAIKKVNSFRPFDRGLRLGRGIMLAVLMTGSVACSDPNPPVSDQELSAFCLKRKNKNLLLEGEYISYRSHRSTNPDEPNDWPNINLDFINSQGETVSLTDDSEAYDSSASVSADRKKVVFFRQGSIRVQNVRASHDFSGKEGLYTVNSDGTDLQRLTVLPNTEMEDNFPSFSSDGQKITFVRTDYSQKPPLDSLHTINADGSDLRTLTESNHHQGSIRRPTFSPDRSKVAYEGNRSTFVIDSDGGNLKQVSKNSEDDMHGIDIGYFWLDNSRQLVIERAFRLNDHDFLNRRFLIGADGWGERDVTTICASETDVFTD